MTLLTSYCPAGCVLGSEGGCPEAHEIKKTWHFGFHRELVEEHPVLTEIQSGFGGSS